MLERSAPYIALRSKYTKLTEFSANVREPKKDPAKFLLRAQLFLALSYCSYLRALGLPRSAKKSR